MRFHMDHARARRMARALREAVKIMRNDAAYRSRARSEGWNALADDVERDALALERAFAISPSDALTWPRHHDEKEIKP